MLVMTKSVLQIVGNDENCVCKMSIKMKSLLKISVMKEICLILKIMESVLL